MFIVDFDHKGQDKLTFIEFLFSNKANDGFLYARNHDISLPLSQAILTRNGIKYLAPEMVLLYKSTDTEREGYQIDYDMAMCLMSDEQKNWLQNALKVMNPNGHKWIENAVMSFDEFLKFRDVKIRNKDHERIVCMFYPLLSSVCSVPDALSKAIGNIFGIDFSESSITTGCFNGVSNGDTAPFGIPDLYCKWDNGITVYVYGALPENSLVALKDNEYVLFALSDKISTIVERTANRYVYMRDIQLRKYRPDNCKSVYELFYNTIHCVNATDYNENQLNAWAPDDMDLEQWNKRLLKNDYAVVAEKDGVIVGIGTADDNGYVDLLYVHKDYQRTGVATEVADDLERYICGQGAKIITTDAFITARPFFGTRGYVVLAEQSVECRRQYLTNFKMQKVSKEEVRR